MRFCSIFGAILRKYLFQVAVLRFYKTKRFAVFKNFRVISMRFAVFLCYSVRCLYVILCAFVVFVPTLRPPLIFLSKNFPVIPPDAPRKLVAFGHSGLLPQRINPRYRQPWPVVLSVSVPFAWYHLSSFSPGCCRGYKAPYTHKSPVCSTRKSKRIAVLNRSCLAS